MEEENSTPVDSSTESDTEVETASPQKKTVTSHKPGIVYLSTVPTGFNVSQTTTFFTEFGRLVGPLSNNSRVSPKFALKFKIFPLRINCWGVISKV